MRCEKFLWQTDAQRTRAPGVDDVDSLKQSNARLDSYKNRGGFLFVFFVKIGEIKRKISLLLAGKHCFSRSSSGETSSIISAQQRKWKGQLLRGWQEARCVISYRIFCVRARARKRVCFNGGWSWQLSGGFLCNSAFRWQRTVRASSPHWRRTCLLIS